MLCNTALMPLRPEQQELNQELRDYFELIDQVKYTLPMEALTAALAQDFPEYSNSNLSSAEILESLGIAHYYRTSIALNHQLMLCSITDSIEDAQALLKKYQQPEYARLRKSLNVMSHWIFAVPRDYLWMCTRNDFTDWNVHHNAVGEPECWIVDELRLVK